MIEKSLPSVEMTLVVAVIAVFWIIRDHRRRRSSK